MKTNIRLSFFTISEGVFTIGLKFPDPVILEGLKEIDADQIMAHFKDERSEYPELERLITAYDETDKPGEKAAIFQEYFEQAMLLWVTGKVNSPGIESLAHLKDRVVKSLERILSTGPGEKETIVVFTSATPVSIITGNLLKLDDLKTMEITFNLNNCSVTEFNLKTRGPVLNSFNCTGQFVSWDGTGTFSGSVALFFLVSFCAMVPGHTKAVFCCGWFFAAR